MKTQIKFAAACLFLLVSAGAYAQTLQEAIRFTESEQYAKANAAFKKLIVAEPTNGDNFFYFGDLLLKQENNDSALLMFKKGIEINATNPLVHVGLARYYMYTGSTAEGQKELTYAKSLLSTQAGKKGTDLPVARQVTIYLEMAETYIWAAEPNADAAIELCNTAEKLDTKNPSAEIYLVRGDAKYKKNQSDASPAIADYNLAYKRDPKSCQAHLRIGQIYAAGKNMKAAIGFFNLAIKTDPTFAPAYRNCGEALYMSADFDSAAINYEQYLKLNNDCYARYRYAGFLYKSNNFLKSIEQGKQNLACDPNNVVMYRIMGNNYNGIAKDSAKSKSAAMYADTALVYYAQFFEKQKVAGRPKLFIDDYLNRAKAYSAVKKDSLAILDLESAIAFDTTRKDLYFELAGKYFVMKKYDKAAYYYKKKIDSNPAKQEISDWNAYGLSLLRMKEFVKADSAFIKVIALDSLSPYGWSGRGKANAGLDPDGSKGLARPFYMKHIELVNALPEKDRPTHKRDLITSNLYFASYYLVRKNYACSKAYYLAVKDLDPKNETAKNGLEDKTIAAATAADISTCKGDK